MSAWLLAPTTILLIVLGLLVAARQREWSFVGGPNDPGRYDFTAEPRRETHNDALACTAGLCSRADWTLPAYAKPPRLLIAELVAALARIDPLSRRVDDGASTGYARLLTFSPIMHFPDAIDIEAVPLDGGATGLRIYSRAKLGRSDFGKNREHIRRLTAALAN